MNYPINERLRMAFGMAKMIEDIIENHTGWIKDSSCNTKYHIYRSSAQFQRWAREVKQRDGCCQCCKSKNKLHAHHIFDFRNYPTLRTDSSNGITLCSICHREFHFIYGNFFNDDKQMQEYLNKYSSINCIKNPTIEPTTSTEKYLKGVCH